MIERMTANMARRLAEESKDGLYGVLLKNGSMELGYYRPSEEDHQQAHQQDEIYIVLSGTGSFVRGTDRVDFAPGDALFVAAGIEHRFVDFSSDFATWVVFYGPQGRELD